MKIFASSQQLEEHVAELGCPMHTLAHAPDGSPVVAVRAGGDRTPAVLVTAGSHSTEQAGVTAAVELIEALETEHVVWIVPTRDPMGMNGYRHVLEHALRQPVALESREALAVFLRSHGEVVIDEGDAVVSLIGECGFTTRNLLGRFGQDHAAQLEALKGRRVFVPAGGDGVDGAAPLERAYTLIVSPEGEALHVNRFHDTVWAPPEVRAIRQLMAEAQPGICFDLHESMGIEDRFWLSARKQRTEALQQLEAHIATEVIGQVAASGAPLVADDYLPHAFFERSETAVFWLDATQRGEGLNLMDFAAREYGIAFGTEMGMYGSFEHRVRLGMLTVQTAVRVWEQYRQ